MDVNEFAQVVLAQQKERLAARFSQWQADAEIVRVIPGPKYTKVDLGTAGGGMSGKFMVENATGIIYGIKGFSVLEEHYKNKKQRARRVAKGMSMTTPEQENRERVLMADGITDVLEDYEYLGKMTRERVMVWYRRFGNLLNLPDLLEKHEKLMKDILRKKYPKGKLGNVVVMPIPDAAPEAPRGNGLLSRLRAKV